ncbi:MAG: hypothetical protein SWE60_19485 [Thermodesulfobacteriota bacterium]|nr:hypothetical protein [Thermodesulfobacteriota bacterium]
MSYEIRFLVALVLTVLIEVPVLFILVRYAFKLNNIKSGKILFVGTVASVLTLPYVWFVIPPLIHSKCYVHVAELFAFGAEAVIYHRLLGTFITVSLALSFVTNAISFLAGWLLF